MSPKAQGVAQLLPSDLSIFKEGGKQSLQKQCCFTLLSSTCSPISAQSQRKLSGALQADCGSKGSEESAAEGCFLVEAMKETAWGNGTITQGSWFCTDRLFAT